MMKTLVRVYDSNDYNLPILILNNLYGVYLVYRYDLIIDAKTLHFQDF